MTPICRLRRPRLALLPARQRREGEDQRTLDEYLLGWHRYDAIVEEDTGWFVHCASCYGEICTCPGCLPAHRSQGAHRYKDGAIVCSFACGRQERDRRARERGPSPFGLLAWAFERARVALGGGS